MPAELFEPDTIEYGRRTLFVGLLLVSITSWAWKNEYKTKRIVFQWNSKINTCGDVSSSLSSYISVGVTVRFCGTAEKFVYIRESLNADISEGM